MHIRDVVALVLAATAGLSVVFLTLAALYDALADPQQAGISTAYSSLLTGTLGVLIGALAGYIGGRRDPAETGPPDPSEARRRQTAGSKTEGGQHHSLDENDSQTDRKADQ